MAWTCQSLKQFIRKYMYVKEKNAVPDVYSIMYKTCGILCVVCVPLVSTGGGGGGVLRGLITPFVLLNAFSLLACLRSFFYQVN